MFYGELVSSWEELRNAVDKLVLENQPPKEK